MPDLNSKEIQEYVKAGGDYCPYCRSPEVEQDDILQYDEDTSAIYKEMTCLTCGSFWTDIFTLAAVKGGNIKMRKGKVK